MAKYVVSSGDTLQTVAKKFEISPSQILSSDFQILKPDTTLSPGSILTLFFDLPVEE